MFELLHSCLQEDNFGIGSKQITNGHSNPLDKEHMIESESWEKHHINTGTIYPEMFVK